MGSRITDSDDSDIIGIAKPLFKQAAYHAQQPERNTNVAFRRKRSA